MSGGVEAESLELAGLRLIKPRVFGDDRGFFLESFRTEDYAAAGVDCTFVQDNHSRSAKGILRGMHLQTHPGQAKLLRVARGRIFDVVVDARPESPTFKRWLGVWLDDKEHHQLFVPVGFAHGFYVDSDVADVCYKVSSIYDAATETGFAWNDPEIGIEWPSDGTPVVSQRDAEAQSFTALMAELGS